MRINSHLQKNPFFALLGLSPVVEQERFSPSMLAPVCGLIIHA